MSLDLSVLKSPRGDNSPLRLPKMRSPKLRLDFSDVLNLCVLITGVDERRRCFGNSTMMPSVGDEVLLPALLGSLDP